MALLKKLSMTRRTFRFVTKPIRIFRWFRKRITLLYRVIKAVEHARRYETSLRGILQAEHEAQIKNNKLIYQETRALRQTIEYFLNL